MNEYITIPNAAFAGALIALALVAFGKISMKTFVLSAGGLLIVGYTTQPSQPSS